MDESKNQQSENQELNLSAENQKSEEVVIFRHPHQILTNKQIQILLTKKEEDLSLLERGALQLFFLRARHHRSKPKQLSTKERAARRNKRRISNASRKANRSY